MRRSPPPRRPASPRPKPAASVPELSPPVPRRAFRRRDRRARSADLSEVPPDDHCAELSEPRAARDFPREPRWKFPSASLQERPPAAPPRERRFPWARLGAEDCSLRRLSAPPVGARRPERSHRRPDGGVERRLASVAELGLRTAARPASRRSDRRQRRHVSARLRWADDRAAATLPRSAEPPASSIPPPPLAALRQRLSEAATARAAPSPAPRPREAGRPPAKPPPPGSPDEAAGRRLPQQLCRLSAGAGAGKHFAEGRS